MKKFDTISKIWNYFQGCANSVQKHEKAYEQANRKADDTILRCMH